GAQTSARFWTKITEDWVMQFSGMLAYNYLIALAPLALALLAIAGLILGSLSPETYQSFVNQLATAMPGGIGHSLIDGILRQLSKSAGLLLVIAVITGVFSGSRLFVAMENCFAVIYRVSNRQAVPQNVVALLMTLLFIILAPLTFTASTIAGTILRAIVPSGVQHNGIAVTAEGFITGGIAAFILFAAIYFVVPNRKVTWKTVWPGALFAAVLLSLYGVLFPIYQGLFLKNAGYGSVVGLAIVVLIFLYYIGLISLLGAEMNTWRVGLRPLGKKLPQLFLAEEQRSDSAAPSA
ncbi:MAG TPA: YihY/virulence factor BrkB family protein, partial [Ktedonobacterales bacterium]